MRLSHLSIAGIALAPVSLPAIGREKRTGHQEKGRTACRHGRSHDGLTRRA
jgi:hypothetical protein